MTGTPQTVTVLFTDLVGSTELLVSLTPDEGNAVRTQHFSSLRQVISATGGTEVKSLGDGLMVTFSSLSRALACAVSMQQAIERHNRRADHPVGIRVGLSHGEATEEDGDYFGEPVIEAARLCAHAEGGQILTTTMCRVMAGRHATQEFFSLGEASLKGLPEPVDLVEVHWAPKQETLQPGKQLPLPDQLVTTSADSLFAFFGRADELKTLEDIHKRAAAENHLGVVLLSGEPGVGKTSLVAQAGRSAHRNGSTVLYGGCEEDLTVPYKPWVDALRPLAESLPEEVLQSFSDTHGLGVARLLPSIARRLGTEPPTTGVDADAERFIVMEGVVRLLASASESTSLMVVLDDLHWADAASLQLLGHLAHASLPMAVSVVATFRDSDVGRGHPLTALLANLRRTPSVDRVGLLGLDDYEIIGLMEAAAGHNLPDDGVALAHTIRRETGGNPFFVVELLRHLVQEGTLAPGDDGMWHLVVDLEEVGLPSSVREVVAHRIATLGEESERALTMAAVIGRDFDLPVLAAVLETDELVLVDTLERATTAGVLSELPGDTERYRFVHALIQHTLYEDQSATRRRRAHLRIAETLEVSGNENPESLAALAHHWLAATRQADVAKAVHYARRAGQAALWANAPADAVGWFTQALEVLGRQGASDERQRCALLVDLGTAQKHAGIPAHRATLLEAAAIARRLADTELLVAAALGSRRGMGDTTEADPERVEVTQGALDALGDADERARALLLTTLAEVTDARDWQRRLELAEEAMALAGRLEDRDRLEVLLACYEFQAQPERSAERLVETAWACATGERLGDPILHFQGCFHRINAAMEVGDIDEVDRRLAEMDHLVERTGLPYCRWQLLLTRTWRTVHAGDLESGERYNDEAFSLGSDIGVPEALTAYGTQLLFMRSVQGRTTELIEPIAQAAAENPAIGVLRMALASAYCSVGRLEEAAEAIAHDAKTGFADLPRDFTWVTAMAAAAEVAVALGDIHAAAILYDLLVPYRSLVIFNSGTCEGAIARPLGCLAHLLGLREQADALFREALEISERINSPYWITSTQLDYAELLYDVERVSEALDLVTRALEISQRYGFGAMTLRATALAG